MPQIFHPSMNVLSRVSIVAIVLAIPVLSVAAYFVNQTYGRHLLVPRNQPVPFSHEHHVGNEEFDCRYCHSSVETSLTAGMPDTHTCMTCHSQLWRESPLLEPVRVSYRENRPIAWNRVNDVPDFAHFNHSIHVQKGVPCVACHGRVDRMPLVWRTETLTMAWCLECHRHPEPRLRPREAVFAMANLPPPAAEQRPHRLTSWQLTNCSICHY